jgi:hypothetical protein
MSSNVLLAHSITMVQERQGAHGVVMECAQVMKRAPRVPLIVGRVRILVAPGLHRAVVMELATMGFAAVQETIMDQIATIKVLGLFYFIILYYIFYILYFIFYILYFIFYILYFIFYILYFIFYILY